MSCLRFACAVALAFGAAVTAHAAALSSGFTAVPLATVTNDRDASVSSLQLMLDGDAEVRGIAMDTRADAGAAPRPDQHRFYPLADIETDAGVVLGQGQGVKAIYLRGTIASRDGRGALVIRYLANGVFRHFSECRIDLQRTAANGWQLVNAYDGQPIDAIRVKTWALGIATIGNVCPAAARG